MADKGKPVSIGTEKNISSIVRQYSGGEQQAAGERAAAKIIDGADKTERGKIAERLKSEAPGIARFLPND